MCSWCIPSLLLAYADLPRATWQKGSLILISFPTLTRGSEHGQGGISHLSSTFSTFGDVCRTPPALQRCRGTGAAIFGVCFYFLAQLPEETKLIRWWGCWATPNTSGAPGVSSSLGAHPRGPGGCGQAGEGRCVQAAGVSTKHCLRLHLNPCIKHLHPAHAYTPSQICALYGWHLVP